MSNTTRIQFIGDGKLTTFAFPFQIFSTEDVVVYLDNIKQTENFSVTKTQESTATVTFNTAPAEGCFITLIRELSPNRKSHFYEGGALHARVLNEEFDYQVACIKQLSDTQKRSLILEPQANASDLTIPQPSGGKALIWNDDGTKLVNSKENFSNIINSVTNQSQLAIQSAEIASQAAQSAKDAAAKTLFNPMEQNGDLIVGGENGTPTKISIGNIGQALSVGQDGLCYQDFAFSDLSNISSETKKTISSFSFPSDNYVDLVLTSGETYIAPANGFLRAGGSASAAGGVITLTNKTSSIAGQSPAGTTRGYGINTYVPAKLGDEIEIYTADINSASFRFIYAEGEI